MADLDIVGAVSADFAIEGNTASQEVKSAPTDRIQIEIGDSKQEDFKPQFKLLRWDNLVNLSLRAIEHPDATAEIVDGIFKYKTPDYEVHQHSAPNAGEDGGFEFKWVLPQRPETNILTATIRTKGLEFYPQPELTEEEIAEGVIRPERIVNSTAVYASALGGLNAEGGPDAKAGKVCHIFRIQLTDANGWQAWGLQHVDVEHELLVVEMPQDYLDKATYPVEVDPTFGFTSAGGSSATGFNEAAYANRFTLTEAGTVSKLTVYRLGDASHQSKGQIWANSASYPAALQGSATPATVLANGVNWNDLTFSSGISLSAADFWLGWSDQSATNALYYYDSGSTNQRYARADGSGDYTTIRNPYPAGATGAARKVSIYATYTTDTTPPIFRPVSRIYQRRRFY